ncbi:hypothetical protein Btru_012898 [Bulinus truncatus]|nr:hypothetical protein Btru_012898 [Bulinus truncatus]
MALLAEAKRKVKFGIDPRNTNWSNDDSKIGQRLLEKMGWEKGKGLGAKEDGMKDHIKAAYKSDTRGLGCTPKDADAWIAHQDDFNELLKQLNSSQKSSDHSQVDRPPDGHKRYYGRFARGQVKTLRSTEDLNCIFGKRKSASEPVTPAAQSGNDSDDENDGKKHGVTTVKSSSSVQEYFAMKMAALKAKKEMTQEPFCTLEKDSGYSNDSHAPCAINTAKNDESNEKDGEKIKKKKKKGKENPKDIIENLVKVEVAKSVECDTKRSSKSKKSKKENTECPLEYELKSQANFTTVPPALVDVPKPESKTEEKLSKKTKKNKDKGEPAIIVENSAESKDTVTVGKIDETKKKSKKEKTKNKFAQSAVNLSVQEVKSSGKYTRAPPVYDEVVSNMTELSSNADFPEAAAKLGKKQKKRKKDDQASEDIVENFAGSEAVSFAEHVHETRKSARNKKAKLDGQLENEVKSANNYTSVPPMYDVGAQSIDNLSVQEVKSSGKYTRVPPVYDEVGSNMTESSSNADFHEATAKHGKKQKKRKKDDQASEDIVENFAGSKAVVIFAEHVNETRKSSSNKKAKLEGPLENEVKSSNNYTSVPPMYDEVVKGKTPMAEVITEKKEKKNKKCKSDSKNIIENSNNFDKTGQDSSAHVSEVDVKINSEGKKRKKDKESSGKIDENSSEPACETEIISPTCDTGESQLNPGDATGKESKPDSKQLEKKKSKNNKECSESVSLEKVASEKKKSDKHVSETFPFSEKENSISPEETCSDSLKKSKKKSELNYDTLITSNQDEKETVSGCLNKVKKNETSQSEKVKESDGRNKKRKTEACCDDGDEQNKKKTNSEPFITSSSTDASEEVKSSGKYTRVPPVYDEVGSNMTESSSNADFHEAAAKLGKKQRKIKKDDQASEDIVENFAGSKAVVIFAEHVNETRKSSRNKKAKLEGPLENEVKSSNNYTSVPPMYDEVVKGTTPVAEVITEKKEKKNKKCKSNSKNIIENSNNFDKTGQDSSAHVSKVDAKINSKGKKRKKDKESSGKIVENSSEPACETKNISPTCEDSGESHLNPGDATGKESKPDSKQLKKKKSKKNKECSESVGVEKVASENKKSDEHVSETSPFSEIENSISPEETCSDSLKKGKLNYDAVTTRNPDEKETVSGCLKKVKKNETSQSEKVKESNGRNKKRKTEACCDDGDEQNKKKTDSEPFITSSSTGPSEEGNDKVKTLKVNKRQNKRKNTKKDKGESTNKSCMFPGSNLGDVVGYAVKKS